MPTHPVSCTCIVCEISNLPRLGSETIATRAARENISKEEAKKRIQEEATNECQVAKERLEAMEKAAESGYKRHGEKLHECNKKDAWKNKDTGCPFYEEKRS